MNLNQKILFKENNIDNKPVFDDSDLKIINELSSQNNNDLNLKEPIIESTPYSISSNINPNIIIYNNKSSNDNAIIIF